MGIYSVTYTYLLGQGVSDDGKGGLVSFGTPFEDGDQV